MRIISRIAILAVVALVVAASIQPASAFCTNGRLVGSCGGAGCKYIYMGTVGASPSASLVGQYWAWGGGNSLPGVGADNGTDQSSGNGDSTINWINGSPAYLGGAWSNAGVDGCVDDATNPSPKRTVVSLSDVGTSAAHAGKLAGFFGILCASANNDLNYDFSTGSHLTMAQIPYPSVTNAAPGSASLAPPKPAGLAAGTIALDAACTGLIRGYKICSILGTSEPQNLNRTTGGWVCGAEIPIGSPATQPVPPCGSNQLLYLATSLVYESGFETTFVSEDTKISCGLTADRPSNFKLIKKPKTAAPGAR